MQPSNGKITYLGHATVLIQLGNLNFLTDPNFSSKLWPLKRRGRVPGLAPQHLPEITAILVSHANRDHLDIFSYKYFKTHTPILTPKGLGKWVQKFLPNPITEVAPAGSHQEGNCVIHALPTMKRGKRWIPLRYTQSTAYLLESPTANIYFPGNTGYGPHFKGAGKRFHIDVALLPIQPQPGHATGPKSSLSPAKALQACEDLGAKVLIPIRWDSFRFGKATAEALLKELTALAQQQNRLQSLKILQPGESLSLPNFTATGAVPGEKFQDSPENLEISDAKPVDGL